MPFRADQPGVERLYARHHTATTGLYLGVLFFFCSALLATPCITTEVGSRSPGMIRTRTPDNEIIAGTGGQVAWTGLIENRRVCAGDTLLVLQTRQLDQQITHLQQQIRDRANRLADLEVLLQAEPLDSLRRPLRTVYYRRSLLQFRQQFRERHLRVDYLEQQEQRQRQLFDGGVIAGAEYEQVAFDLQLARTGRQVVAGQQYQLWSQEKQQTEQELEDLRARARQLELSCRPYVLTAGIDGTLNQLQGLQAGNYISPGQVLGRITADDELLVEAYVSPADIGALQIGTPVRFQVDAFNHHQWGMASGEVISISPDIVLTREQPVFVVQCRLDAAMLQLPNGYAGRLRPGLTLTAHFSLARRTLFQLLYDEVDDWLDPRQQRQNS